MNAEKQGDRHLVSNVALILSVLSLAITGAQAVVAQNGVNVSKQEVAELRSQFDREGPVLKADSQLRVQVGEVSDQIDPGDFTYKGNQADIPVVTEKFLDPLTEAYLFFTVSNFGRSTTTLLSARLRPPEVVSLSPAIYPVDAVVNQPGGYFAYCGYFDPPIEPCVQQFPIELSEGRTYVIAFPLKQILPWIHEVVSEPTRFNLEIAAVGIRNDKYLYTSNVRVSK